MTLTLNDLLVAIKEKGLDLGANPARTLRYYISRGLLSSPEIRYNGKTKQAIYSQDHLSTLQLICEYKIKGYKLDEIKEKIQEPIYLTDQALEFLNDTIKENNYPHEAFRKDKPLTRAEMAVIIYHLYQAIINGKVKWNLLNEFFVDGSGRKAFHIVDGGAIKLGEEKF